VSTTADLVAATPAAHRAARELLRPWFEALRLLFGPPLDLPRPDERRRGMGAEDDSSRLWQRLGKLG